MIFLCNPPFPIGFSAWPPRPVQPVKGGYCMSKMERWFARMKDVIEKDRSRRKLPSVKIHMIRMIYMIVIEASELLTRVENYGNTNKNELGRI